MPSALSRGKIDKLVNDLERQGTRVEWQGKNVRKLYFPNGSWAQVHNSPSDINWTYNVRRRVIAAGLVWPLEDSKKTKAAHKSHASAKPPIPENWERPEAPFDHVQEPPGLGFYKNFKGIRNDRTRPTDKQIGYVRGALFKMGNPETFWTAQVADELRDVTGFRGASGNEIHGTLDWLGYRVREARKYKVGHIYRWVLDPTKDRAAAETLPMLVPQDKPVDEPVEPEETPAEPETPTPEPEAVSEAPVAAEEVLSEPIRDTNERPGYTETELEHYQRQARRYSGLYLEVKRELETAQQQIRDLEARLEVRVQAEDGWDAIEFRADRQWGEMQEWATSFGLDLVVKVKRA